MTGPRVTTAELPGEDGSSEDRVYVGGNCVVVLDGVSALRPDGPRSGWYPETLGEAITETLAKRPSGELRDVVAQAIAGVAVRHQLIPGEAPSSTVAIARWSDSHLRGLVLGDSPIVVYGKDGGVDVFRDARHDAVVAELRRAQARENGMQGRDTDEVQALIRATRPAKLQRMNRDGGYWIAEASPLAGHRALMRRWPIDDLAAVLLVTDGVSCGVDDYAVPPSWPAALDLVLSDGLEDLLRSVHKAEAGDPNARRWPRGKRHDDKAAALLLFAHQLTQAPR
jgi:hypothetical protein